MELVQHSDLEVKIDACWALSFLADGNSKQIQVSMCCILQLVHGLLWLTESGGVRGHPSSHSPPPPWGEQSGGMSQKVTITLYMASSVIPPVQLPTLRTLGNIVTGNDAQTQAVLNAGILQYLHALLHHDRPGIVRVSASHGAEMGYKVHDLL